MGLVLPKRLALGAAMGVLASLIKLKAILSAGILIAIVSKPAVTIPETNSDFLRTKAVSYTHLTLPTILLV